MSNDLKRDWQEIVLVFKEAQASSRHCAIATVREDGAPHMTPIGSLFLRDDLTGYYFEEYSRGIPRDLERNRQVCVMAVNSGWKYWFKSVFAGSFATAPGIRLYGVAGDLREATEEEIASWQKRVKIARNMKGYDLIWKNLKQVREIRFHSFEPVTAGRMTQHLWKG